MNNICLSIHSKLTKFKYCNNIICILNTTSKEIVNENTLCCESINYNKNIPLLNEKHIISFIKKT